MVEGRKTWTVAELTRGLKTMIETEFKSIWLEGEISNYKVAPSGHSYFTLKDAKTQIGAVIWKGSRKYVRFTPKDGDQVLCRGRVTVYEARGNYQFVAEAMEPKGLGALQAAYEELKLKLDKEGLFNEGRKKALPPYPFTIGLVTSPAGAVIRDIIRTFNRRFPGLRIILAPALVQGPGAAAEISKAIADLNNHNQSEVIIVARGGGSIEDLWAFNEESVARAIAASTIPIVSAVGHETDFTIADFVADIRASTPTAAAELVVTERIAVEEVISGSVRSMRLRLRDQIESRSQTLDDVFRRLDRETNACLIRVRTRVEGLTKHLRAVSPMVKLARNRDRLHNIITIFSNAQNLLLDRRKNAYEKVNARLSITHAQLVLANGRDKTIRAEERLHSGVVRRMQTRRALLTPTMARLHAVSPLAVLERGYALVTTNDGKGIYRSAIDLPIGETVHLQFAHDKAAAKIVDALPKKKKLKKPAPDSQEKDRQEPLW